MAFPVSTPCGGDDSCVSFDCVESSHNDVSCQAAGCGNSVNWYANCDSQLEQCPVGNSPYYGDRCRGGCQQEGCPQDLTQAAWCMMEEDCNARLCVRVDDDLAAKGAILVGGNCSESAQCASKVCLEGFCRRADNRCDNPEDCDSWVCDKGTCREFSTKDLDEMYNVSSDPGGTRAAFKTALLQQGLPASSFRVDQWPISFAIIDDYENDRYRTPSVPCKRSLNLVHPYLKVAWPKDDVRFLHV